MADIDPDDVDWNPEPPTPAVPAVISCRECHGEGIRRMQTGDRLSDWVAVACRACQGTGAAVASLAPACLACDGSGICPRSPESRCWYCNGSGVDDLAAAPSAAPTTFDRAAHCQAIAAGGGARTVAPYGVAHIRAIGKAGARATIRHHGVGFWRGVTTAKGWAGPRTPDLALGEYLVDAA